MRPLSFDIEKQDHEIEAAQVMARQINLKEISK